jgi:two-component system sensor histidine kinase ChiS
METKKTAINAKKILVADDNKVFLKAMSIMLTAKGYHVLVAESGADTIGIVRKEKPDLILLDLDFPPDFSNIGGPLRDGFLIIDWARRTCDAEKIPVIIISSMDPEEYRDRAQAAGILTFFKKPMDQEKLLESIRAKLGEAPAGSPV